MGKRGPKPTPLRVLEGRGSKLAADRQAEPQAPTGDLVCPDYLAPLAHDYWAEIYPILVEMKIVTLADRNCLAVLCLNLAEAQTIYEFIQLNRELRASGDGGEGEQKLRLARADMHRCHDMANKMMDRLGLSPGARANMKVSPAQDTPNDRAKFFKNAQRG